MSVRTVSTRVDVFRNGAQLLTLRAVDNPEIDMEREAVIRTSLYGSFRPDSRVDWLTDELRPVLTINGTDHPYGVYLPTTVKHRRDEDIGPVVEVDAYDRGWLVQSRRTESILHLDAGTYYLAAVRSLLQDAGIELVLETPSAATLASAREDWPVGTDYLTIVNQLLGEISYERLWFDASGCAVLEPARVPDADSIRHTLDAAQIDSLILPDFAAEQDVFDAPNVFVCLCSNPDLGAALTATAVNDNAQSPLSTVRRGRRIAQVVKVDSTPSQAALDAYAARLRNDSLLVSEVVQVRTALLPGYAVGDSVALVHPEVQGLYIEDSCRVRFAPGGDMTHGLRRVVLSV